jgi:hypothetical protein
MSSVVCVDDDGKFDHQRFMANIQNLIPTSEAIDARGSDEMEKLHFGIGMYSLGIGSISQLK